jgi:hypothetical protein
MDDLHFYEKMFHFDHERIPERVVLARGYARMASSRPMIHRISPPLVSEDFDDGSRRSCRGGRWGLLNAAPTDSASRTVRDRACPDHRLVLITRKGEAFSGLAVRDLSKLC